MRFLVSSFSFICTVVNHSIVESEIMVQFTTQERFFIVKNISRPEGMLRVRERFQNEFPGGPPAPVSSSTSIDDLTAKIAPEIRNVKRNPMLI